MKFFIIKPGDVKTKWSEKGNWLKFAWHKKQNLRDDPLVKDYNLNVKLEKMLIGSSKPIYFFKLNEKPQKNPAKSNSTNVLPR